MKIFSIDSPLMRVLGKISDLMILNFLVLLMCIPVVTAGAAFTAMHYCALKLVRGHESSIPKQFFHSFKDNFRQATVIWLIFLGIVAIFVVDFLYLGAGRNDLGGFVLGGILAFFGMILFVGTMVYPLLARFVNTVRNTIKTAFVYSFRHFLRTLLMLAANLFPLSLFVIFNGYFGIMLFPLILCFGFTAPAYICAKLYDKPFQKAEEAFYAEHPELTTPPEERVFSDH